jgi:hypothetical protein
MRRLPALLLTLFFAAVVAAAPLPLAARAEVDGLLARLESSACEFNRNGSWYGAGEARAHLLRKLAWLEDKGLVQNAEQFIERAASKSSISGEPYLVRCANGTPVDSGSWLRAQLKSIRSAERAPASGAK